MIRWITENLGTAPASEKSVTSDFAILDVRDLVDKFGNSAIATKEKIDWGLKLLRQGKRVVVCCDYGISRSNAIAAGILSLHNDMSLNEAIKAVIQATGEHEIKLEPLQSVRLALEDEPLAKPHDAEHRILLTGGAGFIGQALFRELSKQYYVIAPLRADVDILAGALELDLLVKEHQINCIVHLANPRIYTSTHAIGDTLVLLRNVLEVCKENNIHLIYPSGWEVYSAYRANEIIAGENLPLFPKGPYGEAKLLCENLIAHHRSLHGLKCGLLRSAPLYGNNSDKPKFIYNFIGKAKTNQPIATHRYLNGDPKLDLLHIDDFVTAVIGAIGKYFIGNVNIGTGRSVSTWQIAEWIIEETGSTSTLSARNIDDYVANITMDISLAQKALNWQPTVTWDTGLRNLLEQLQTGKGGYPDDK